MAKAILDLHERLTMLESRNSDDETDSPGVLLDIQSDVHALHNRVISVMHAVNDIDRQLDKDTNGDGSLYYLQSIERQVNRVESKVDGLSNRQRTAEQLLDAIRVYAAERTARDEQTAEPDQRENGDSV